MHTLKISSNFICVIVSVAAAAQAENCKYLFKRWSPNHYGNTIYTDQVYL